MELVKNIFFNTDKIVQNSKIKIFYVGRLFSENSNNLYIHYGFNENWEETSDIEMNKTELGFQVELDIPEYDSFNFCFRTDSYEWDNNDGNNYVFPIEKVSVAMVPINDESSNLLSNKKSHKKSFLIYQKIKLTLSKVFSHVPRIFTKSTTSEKNSTK